MPKAILEFKLPEESDEFELANKATDYSIVLRELDQVLRNEIKYPSDSQSEEVTKALQSIRDRLYELANEYNIEI